MHFPGLTACAATGPPTSPPRGSAKQRAFVRSYSSEWVSAASAMIARICFMIFGCSIAPLWNGTVTLNWRFPYIRWLPFERRSSKAAKNSDLSASAAVHRGSLGIHLDGGCQNFTAQEHISLVDR